MKFEFETSFLDCVDEVQNVAMEIYGRYDLEKSMLWMTEEFGEFFKSIRKEESKERIMEEMGDLLAWILCMGNILDIRVADAIELTMKKEINRQLEVYHKLKYSSNLKYLDIAAEEKAPKI